MTLSELNSYIDEQIQQLVSTEKHRLAEKTIAQFAQDRILDVDYSSALATVSDQTLSARKIYAKIEAVAAAFPGVGTAGQLYQYQSGAWVKTTTIQDKYGNIAVDIGQTYPWYSFHGLQVQDGYGIDVVTTGTLNLGVNNATTVVLDVQADSSGTVLIGGHADITYIGVTDSNVIELADGFIGLKAGGSSDPTSISIFAATTTIGNELLVSADATDPLGVVTLQQLNNALVGLYDDRGNYDASTNLFPSTGGSGTAGTILKGNIWTISVAGTLGGTAVKLGDTVRALVDLPGIISTNWQITEHGLGYTPITNVLNSAQILVGNSSNVATPVSMTGDISITNAGVTAIGAGKVVNTMIASMTSSQFASIISDETGSGNLVFSNSPVFTTPNIGSATGSISGNAGSATILANARTISIAGDVTYTSPSFDGSSNVSATATVVKINGTQLSSLSTGILKNTTGTGIPSIAIAADFPTLNQNTTGNSATATLATAATALATPRTINGVNFDGSANITVTVPVSSGITGLGTGVATFLATPSSANLLTALTTSTGTGVNVFDTAPTFTTSITTPLAIVPSTGTGYDIYNTVDQVTNYERLRSLVTGNVFTITTQQGGTGIVRNLSIGSLNKKLLFNDASTLLGSYNFQNGSTVAATSFVGINGTFGNSSGNVNGLAFFNTINQSSSSGYKIILASVFESALGSGTHLLMDLGTNSASAGSGTHTSKASIDNAGNVVISGSLNKMTVTPPATSATLTLADGSTFILSGAFATTLIATATTNATLPAGTSTLSKSCDVQTFTSSGTWTMPTGAKSVTVLCIGPGGGGGSGRVSASGTLATGGSGGACGATSQMTFRAVDLASSVSVLTATGGLGASAQSSSNSDGNAGNLATVSSSFGSYLVGGRGNPGNAGTAVTGAAGGGGSSGMYNSIAGGSSSATGGAGNSGLNGTGLCGGSGGAGGGITTGAVASSGGNGGVPNMTGGGIVPTGGAINNPGTDGAVTTNPYTATGGGGGGSSVTGNGGKGGKGGSYGAGGGGGGSALNGFSSGAGGNGGDGIVVVITYF